MVTIDNVYSPPCSLQVIRWFIFSFWSFSGAYLSPHADRKARDISFTVCLFVSLFVRKIFYNEYIRRRLTQSDEIWQDGRHGWVAGHFLFFLTLAQGLATRLKNFKRQIFGLAFHYLTVHIGATRNFSTQNLASKWPTLYHRRSSSRGLSAIAELLVYFALVSGIMGNVLSEICTLFV